MKGKRPKEKREIDLHLEGKTKKEAYKGYIPRGSLVHENTKRVVKKEK